jgi:hypothetical protein
MALLDLSSKCPALCGASMAATYGSPIGVHLSVQRPKTAVENPMALMCTGRVSFGNQQPSREERQRQSGSEN